MTLKKLSLLAIILALLGACENGAPIEHGASSPQTEQAENKASIDAPPQEPPATLKREFEEVTADDVHPAFTHHTVTKLNAIVQRSLEVANAYTRSIQNIRHTVDAAAAENAEPADRASAEAGLEKLDALHFAALTAREDMDDAVSTLRASNERFNEEILAGMIKYVTDVEEALGAEVKMLTAKLDQE